MTNNQKIKYNKMHSALVRIKCYQTPNQLKRDSEKDWGLDYVEALEMAYENMQIEAKQALKNVRVID